MKNIAKSLLLVLAFITSGFAQTVKWDSEKVWGPGSAPDGTNVTVSAEGTRQEFSFHTLNHLLVGENGGVTFDIPTNQSNAQFGLSNRASSATNSAYVSWSVQVGSGKVYFRNEGVLTEVGTIARDDQNVLIPGDISCSVSRNGDDITITANGPGVNASETYSVANISQMELLANGALWYSDAVVKNIQTTFYDRIQVDADFSQRASANSINLAIAGGTGSYTINWSKDGGTFTSSSTSLSNLPKGTYRVRISDDRGAISQIERVFHVLGHTKPIVYHEEGSLRDGGAFSDSYDADVYNVGATGGSFGAKNRMSANENGAITYSWTAWELGTGMRLGLTNWESSASINANVHYAVEWKRHPYGDAVRIDVGDGYEEIPVTRFPNTSMPKDNHYTAKIERVGDEIIATVSCQGQTNWEEVRRKTIPGVSQKELYVDAYTSVSDCAFNDFNVNFGTPIKFTEHVKMLDKKIALDIEGGSGAYKVSFINPDGHTIATFPANTNTGLTEKNLPSGYKDFTVLVEDASANFPSDVYRRSRVIHVIDYPKPIVVDNGDGMLHGGGQVSAEYDADLTQLVNNNKQASFQFHNRLGQGEDGAILFSFDLRDNYTQTIGFTPYQASLMYNNIAVKYYVQFAPHVHGDNIRVNLGDGAESVLLNRYADGGIIKDCRVTGRIERIGDKIRIQLDIDGQEYRHEVFEKEIPGISQRQLVVDCGTAAYGDTKSVFENVNVSFGTPIHLTDDIDQTTKNVQITPTGGSGDYKIVWRNMDGSAIDYIAEGATDVTFNEGGTYKVEITDKGHGYDPSVYKRTRVYEILDNARAMSYYGKNAIRGGTVSAEYNADVTSDATATASFGISNYMSPNEDGTIVYTWDARSMTSAGRIGFTGLDNSTSDDAGVNFYIEWGNGGRNNTIRVRTSELPYVEYMDPGYTDGHVRHDVRYMAKIQRVGNKIVATLHADGPEINWTKTWEGTPTEDVSAKYLYPDVMIGYQGTVFNNVNVDFATPINIVDEVQQENKRVILTPTGGSGQYEVVWKNENDEVIGTEMDKTFLTAGTYKAIVTDKLFDAEDYKRERIYYILESAKPMTYFSEGEIVGGNLSGEYNATLTSKATSTQVASFGLGNHMNGGEDGVMIFRWNTLDNASMIRLGFTNRLASLNYNNAGVQHYIEFYKDGRNNRVRVNVGNGIEEQMDLGYVDGHVNKDMFYTAKIERIGDKIKATLHADGQINWTREWTGPVIEGLSTKRLYPDVYIGNKASYIKDVNVSFATPLYVDETIDQVNKTVDLTVTGGSGQFNVDWKDENGTSVASGLNAQFNQAGTYVAHITDAIYDAEVYKVSRPYHIWAEGQKMTWTVRQKGNEVISDDYVADISSGSAGTSLVSENLLEANADGGFTYMYNTRERRTGRAGFTNVDDSYNQQYAYMGYWFEHARGNNFFRLRYNIGEGIKEETYYNHSDGHAIKDVNVVVKMERKGDQLILTLDGDGELEFHHVFTSTPDGFADENLLLDIHLPETISLFENFSTSFESPVDPLEITLTPKGNTSCDAVNGSIVVNVTSGNDQVDFTLSGPEGFTFDTYVNTGGEIAVEFLKPGTYTFNATDAAGETFESTIEIDELTSTVENAWIEVNTEKYCQQNAILEVKTDDPSKTYNVSWSLLQDGNYVKTSEEMTLEHDAGGAYAYDIDITEAGAENICPKEFTGTIEVADNTPFTVDYNVVDATCDEEGGVELVINGTISDNLQTYIGVKYFDEEGRDQYRYSRVNEKDNFLSLPAAELTYLEVKATDNSIVFSTDPYAKCYSNKIIETGVTIDGPEKLTAEVVGYGKEYCEDYSANIVANIEGGSGDYEIAFNSVYVGNNNLSYSSNGTNEITGFNYGGKMNYTLSVTDNLDANTCPIENMTGQVDLATTKGGEVDFEFEMINGTCGNDGKLIVTPINPSNENGIYQVIAWRKVGGGLTLGGMSHENMTVDRGQTNLTFNLPVGEYKSVTASFRKYDGYPACQAWAITEAFEITSPGENIQATIQSKNEDCGQGNGMVYVENTDGRTLNYDWNIVNTVDGSDVSSTDHQVALAAGTYEVSCVVTDRADASVCELRLDETIIIENKELTASVRRVDPLCDGDKGEMFLEVLEGGSDDMYYYYGAIPKDGGAAIFGDENTPLPIEAEVYSYMEMKVINNDTKCEYKWTNTNGDYTVRKSGKNVSGYFSGYDQACNSPSGAVSFNINQSVDAQYQWNITNTETGERINPNKWSWRVQHFPAGIYDIELTLKPRNGFEETHCPTVRTQRRTVTGPAQYEVEVMDATCEEQGGVALKMNNKSYHRGSSITSGTFFVNNPYRDHNGGFSIALDPGTYGTYSYNVTDDAGCNQTFTSTENVVVGGQTSEITAEIVGKDALCDNGITRFELENTNAGIESYTWNVSNTQTGTTYTGTGKWFDVEDAGNFDVEVVLTSSDANVCGSTITGNVNTARVYPFNYERIVTDARCEDQGSLAMLVTDKETGAPYGFNDPYFYYVAVPASGYNPNLILQTGEPLLLDEGDYSDPRSEVKVIEHMADGETCIASIKGGFMIEDASPAEKITFELEAYPLTCYPESEINLRNVSVGSYDYELSSEEGQTYNEGRSWNVNSVGEKQVRVQITDRRNELCPVDEITTVTVEDGRIIRDVEVALEQVDCRNSIMFSVVNNGPEFNGESMWWELEHVGTGQHYNVKDEHTNEQIINGELTLYRGGTYKATFMMNEINGVPMPGGNSDEHFDVCPVEMEVFIDVEETCNRLDIQRTEVVDAEDCIEAGSVTFDILNADGVVHYMAVKHGRHEPTHIDGTPMTHDDHMKFQDIYHLHAIETYETTGLGQQVVFDKLAPGDYDVIFFDESSFDEQRMSFRIEQHYEDPEMPHHILEDAILGCEGAPVTFHDEWERINYENERHRGYPNLEWTFTAVEMDPMPEDHPEYEDKTISSSTLPLMVQHDGRFEIIPFAYDPVTGCTFRSMEEEHRVNIQDGRLIQDEIEEMNNRIQVLGETWTDCYHGPAVKYIGSFRTGPASGSQAKYQWTVTHEDGSITKNDIEYEHYREHYDKFKNGGEHHILLEIYNDYDCVIPVELTHRFYDDREFVDATLEFTNQFCETPASMTIVPAIEGTDYYYEWKFRREEFEDHYHGLSQDRISEQTVNTELDRYYGTAMVVDLNNQDELCPKEIDFDHTFVDEGNFTIDGFNNSVAAECNLDGEVEIQLAGAPSARMTYELSATVGGSNEVTASTSTMNLPSGDYEMAATVTDHETGCVRSTKSVPVTVETVNPLEATINIEDAHCRRAGYAEATIEGGSGDYTYEWRIDDGSWGPAYRTFRRKPQLSTGTQYENFWLTITDNVSGCTVDPYHGPKYIRNINNITVETSKTRDADCSFDGKVTANVTGAVGSLQHTWRLVGTNTVSRNNYFNLPAGTHRTTLYVKDRYTNCTRYMRETHTIDLNNTMTAEVVVVDEAECDDKGKIAVEYAGLPNTRVNYNWTITGDEEINSTNKNVKLADGNYAYTVRVDHRTSDCFVELTNDDFVMERTSPLNLTVEKTRDQKCVSNGKIYSTVTGHSKDNNLTYEWTVTDAEGTVSNSPYSAAYLPAGTYEANLFVTDSKKNCTAEVTETVEVLNLDCDVVVEHLMELPCVGRNGSIEMRLSGGTGNYAYQVIPYSRISKNSEPYISSAGRRKAARGEFTEGETVTATPSGSFRWNGANLYSRMRVIIFEVLDNGEYVTVVNTDIDIMKAEKAACEGNGQRIAEPEVEEEEAEVETHAIDMDIIEEEGMEVEQLDFTYYPNPTNNEFNIEVSSELENAQIQIFNAVGALTFDGDITGMKETIDVSQYNPGMYFARIKVNGVVIDQKSFIVSQ